MLVSSEGLSTIQSSASSSSSPDLEKSKQQTSQELTNLSLHIWSSVETRTTDVSYPKSVVPGTRAEGRPIWRNAQGTDPVLMAKQNGDACPFENIPNIDGVVVVASKQ